MAAGAQLTKGLGTSWNMCLTWGKRATVLIDQFKSAGEGRWGGGAGERVHALALRIVGALEPDNGIRLRDAGVELAVKAPL